MVLTPRRWIFVPCSNGQRLERLETSARLVLGLVCCLSGCGKDEGVAASVEPVFGDPCRFATCGHGACQADAAGEPQCACDLGYEGNRCTDCDVGFHRDFDELCVADTSCLEQPAVLCGLHGHCTDQSGVVACDCDTGYEGARCNLCVSGYGRDEFNECLQMVLSEGGAQMLPPTCLSSSCNGHGQCSLPNGRVSCACFPGYVGERCETCTSGYLKRDSRCVADVPCGASACGACEAFGSIPEFPQRPSNCVASDAMELDDLSMSSLGGEGTIWLCGPAPLYGMATEHVALESSATRPAEIVFKRAIKSLQLNYGGRSFGVSKTFSVEVSGDDKVVTALEDSRLTTGPLTLTFNPPVKTVTFRNLGTSLEELGFDDLVYEPATCE